MAAEPPPNSGPLPPLHDHVNSAADTQRHLWTIGDYPTIARHLLPISVETVEAANVTAGDRVLDVATGDGNAAIEAAKRGATVTGIDLTPAQIDFARTRAEAEGVEIELRVGDAEALDVADGSFDVVVSVMGAIFAPDHERATAELARACRPGGVIALTAWAKDGWFAIWREAVADLAPPPPPGAARADEWSDPDEVRRRCASAGLDARVESRPFEWSFESVESCVELFITSSGPFISFFEAMRDAGAEDDARARLVGALRRANTATDGTCVLPSPYLLAVARR